MAKYNTKSELEPNIYTPAWLLGCKLVGYVQGDELLKKQGVEMENFDTIIKIKESKSEKKNKTYIHAMGYLNKTPYVLVLERENS